VIILGRRLLLAGIREDGEPERHPAVMPRQSAMQAA